MVLVLTDEFDKHADYVLEKLEALNYKYYRFNLNVDALKNTMVTFDGVDWKVNQSGFSFSTNEVSCVWCRRPFVELMLDEKNSNDIDFKIWKNEWDKTLLGLYTSLKDLQWLNPLRKAFKGENKYYQIEIAKKVGLAMPPMIVSNNKDDLILFALANNDDVVFKLMHQDIYQTKDGQFKGLYVNRINSNDINKIFQDKFENPIVLQRYVDKLFEVRYTVVKSSHFACKIESQQSTISNVDWRRYDIPNTPHYKIDPPRFIVTKVNQLMTELGLEFGTIDFIVTPQGEWIFTMKHLFLP